MTESFDTIHSIHHHWWLVYRHLLHVVNLGEIHSKWDLMVLQNIEHEIWWKYMIFLTEYYHDPRDVNDLLRWYLVCTWHLLQSNRPIRSMCHTLEWLSIDMDFYNPHCIPNRSLLRGNIPHTHSWLWSHLVQMMKTVQTLLELLLWFCCTVFLSLIEEALPIT